MASSSYGRVGQGKSEKSRKVTWLGALDDLIDIFVCPLLVTDVK